MYDFKPFDKVLMRDSEHEIWEPTLFSGKVGDAFKDIGLIVYKYCIPYEGNESLAGTYNAPKSIWEPKPGELVAFSDNGVMWYLGIIFNKEIRVDGSISYIGNRTSDKYQMKRYKFCEPVKKHFDFTLPKLKRTLMEN